MLNAILSRWARTRASSQSTLDRMIVGRASSDSIWQTLLRWMPGEADPWNPGGRRSQQAHAGQMAAARAAFAACLAGLEHADAPAGESIGELQRRIRRARDLRTLWNLRTWVYTEVARAHSQHEAEQRLAGLNPLFPVGVAGRQALAAARRQRRH